VDSYQPSNSGRFVKIAPNRTQKTRKSYIHSIFSCDCASQKERPVIYINGRSHQRYKTAKLDEFPKVATLRILFLPKCTVSLWRTRIAREVVFIAVSISVPSSPFPYLCNHRGQELTIFTMGNKN